MGWGRALLRSAIALGPLWASLLPGTWTGLVAYAWLLVIAGSTWADPDRRGLHDRAAGTVVVRD